MREFLDILQLSDSVLVGSSLGGLAALRVALHTPDRVSALCLIGSAGLGREVSPEPMAEWVAMPGVLVASFVIKAGPGIRRTWPIRVCGA